VKKFILRTNRLCKRQKEDNICAVVGKEGAEKIMWAQGGRRWRMQNVA
jgi:hypothetical protein